jgi:hypothetical protein
MALFGISLNAVSAVGPGQAVVPDTPKRGNAVNASFQTTGSPTVNFDLEGTIDNEIWRTIVSESTGEAGGILNNTDPGNNVFTAFRVNLTSISGGSSPTFTASIAILP